MPPSGIYEKSARQNGAVVNLWKNSQTKRHRLGFIKKTTTRKSALSQCISENLTKKTLSRVRWKFLLHKKLNKELAANNKAKLTSLFLEWLSFLLSRKNQLYREINNLVLHNYSWTSLFRPRLFRSPRFFEHKPISLEMHFQSCTIGYLEVPAIVNCFSTPLAWEFEIPGFNCITVPGFGYLYGLAWPVHRLKRKHCKGMK